MKSILKSYLSLMRPNQWLKNLLLFFPPFFGGKIFDPSAINVMVPAFLSFSFATSCGYILNDIMDREYDSLHRSKKWRPIASGEIKIFSASLVALAFYVAAMITAGAVSARFEGFVIIYLFISFLYTVYFKHMVIADIFFIAFGFLIRVLAGGEAFHITVTKWLSITVLLVALFLATGKRLGEVLASGENALAHRGALARYTSSFLDSTLMVFASAALVTYSLYTVENPGGIFYTVPLVAFGLIRYIFLVKQGKGDPTDALLKDPHILMTGIMWAALLGLMLYQK